MNYIAYTARFLYRIKWWLILAPIIVALAVFFKMGAQPRNYKSMTTVYTGIVSGYDITTTEGTRQDWNIINNAMDNLINIILSQTTLKNVSMRLYAQGLTHLDPDNDNQYLTARTSRYLLNRTPKEVMDLADVQHGMILVTGTAGSGKSTTQACIIDQINRTREAHVITLEDPIEFLHRNQRCIVSQREIATDTADYLSALRACLRQAPDVIQLGEMRDHETIRTAMTAAETGHLLIATLHTKGAVNTIDRIVDSFPSSQQGQVRVQLSMVLHTVVSQQLLPDVNGGLVPAFEIMHTNNAIRNQIRESKTHQIDSTIAAGSAEGMITMEQSILNLYHAGRISKETVLLYSENPDQLRRRLG